METKSKKATEAKKPNWPELRQKKKSLSRKQSKWFFRYGKINDTEDGANAKSADGELHKHGKTQITLDWAIQRSNPMTWNNS